jgi:transcriptional regulator with PAS, ATPase and Fis domain
MGETLPTSHDREGASHNAADAYLVLALLSDQPLASPERYPLRDIDLVVVGRDRAPSTERVTDRSQRHLMLRVPSAQVSARHFELVRALGRWTLRDTGSRNGVRVNGVVEKLAVLGDGDVIEAGHTFFVFRQGGAGETQPTASLEDAEAPAEGLATLSAEYERRLAELRIVARSAASIVLTGETGTGKELVARAVHTLSGRSGSFVAVNCGAIAPTLLEAELFGHRKGAFSGATADRAGLVRSADAGTLLLDEIGDLPPTGQAAILRVLQEREVLAVGSSRPVPVDFRLVTTTHRPLSELVASGKLRPDLSARLAGHELHLLPLRERREDLGLLTAALLRRIAKDNAERLSLSGPVSRALFGHEWPLNIRELQKVFEAAVPLALANDGVVALEHLPHAMQVPPMAKRVHEPLSDVEEARRREIVELLRRHGGSVSGAARSMGKARSQLQRWLRRYRIDPKNLDS